MAKDHCQPNIMRMNSLLLKIRPLFLLSIASFACSCVGRSERQDVTRLVNEWQGREVLLPDSVFFTVLAEDTVPSPDRAGAPYKVFSYVDDAGCVSCQLKLGGWQSLIAEVDSLTGGAVPFLFYIGTRDVPGLRQLLRRDSFDYPVCIDAENYIDRLNHFPAKQAFRTFLLDGSNRVLVMGNPVHNPTVWRLYMEEIKKDPSSRNISTSLLGADRQDIDLGKVRLGATKEMKVRIINEGEQTFVLGGVNTSCDCTEVICPWTEIPSGKARRLTVRFRADSEGDFTREVYIHGNLPNAPYILTLSGTVISK